MPQAALEFRWYLLFLRRQQLFAVSHLRLRHENKLLRLPNPFLKVIQLDRSTHVPTRFAHQQVQLGGSPTRISALRVKQHGLVIRQHRRSNGYAVWRQLQLLQVHVVPQKLQRARQPAGAHEDSHGREALQVQILPSHLHHHRQQKRSLAPPHQRQAVQMRPVRDSVLPQVPTSEAPGHETWLEKGGCAWHDCWLRWHFCYTYKCASQYQRRSVAPNRLFSTTLSLS